MVKNHLDGRVSRPTRGVMRRTLNGRTVCPPPPKKWSRNSPLECFGCADDNYPSLSPRGEPILESLEFLVAITAIHRLVTGRPERHLCFHTAIAANDCEHLPLGTV